MPGRGLPRDDGIEALVTPHPSALLRGDPAARARAFERRVAKLALASSARRST